MSVCYTCAKYEADCTTGPIPICSICARSYKITTDQDRQAEAQRQYEAQTTLPDIEFDRDFSTIIPPYDDRDTPF